MNDLISQCLADIPYGKYHDRTEKELRDHMESLYLSLTEGGMEPDQAQGEALRAMGEPDKLQEEYRAAWQRSLPGRLEQLGLQLIAWTLGCAVMLGVHLLIVFGMSYVWQMAISLPGASQDPWIRMIRGTVGNLNGSWFWYLLPLVSALFVGAYFLGRTFQISRHPVWKISVGLSFHVTFIVAFQIWWEAIDDHITFWQELNSQNLRYYSLTLAFCVLLGVVFGHMSERKRMSATA